MPKIRKDIFITALVITVAIFLLGFYTAKIWDDLRTSDVAYNLNQNNLDIISIFVEQQFLESLDIGNCNLIKERLSSSSGNLYDLGQRLMEYDDKNILKEKEYDSLREQYFLLEIRAYSLFIDYNKKCDNKQNIILYFYDLEEDNSIKQGYVLDNLANRQDINIKIFSIDRQFDEPTLNLVKNYYNITKAPTIIVNNKDKKEGFTSVGEVFALVKNE
ncbi:MAG: hypothetical protein PHD81_01035 [Candidatus Nanoarchaeia archaeon]|nr:hypothetical protein [Candidatus Nanoarchaeia archaeon]